MTKKYGAITGVRANVLEQALRSLAALRQHGVTYKIQGPGFSVSDTQEVKKRHREWPPEIRTAIRALNVGEVAEIQAPTSFTFDKTRAYVAAVGYSTFGQGNFSTKRASANSVEVMRVG
jgi:hypothetical protein